MTSYNDLVNKVWKQGATVESRYGVTRELLAEQFTFQAGTLVWRPKFAKALGWMELLQLVSGIYKPMEIRRVVPGAQAGLFTEQMAYGPRVVGQVQTVINALKEDPLTRQAVLFIARVEDGPTSSLPCTLALQFILRFGILHCNVTMRSWDLIRGLPYDIVMFGGMTQVMAHLLGVRAGLVRVTAGSTHVYGADRELFPEFEKRNSFTFHLRGLDSLEDIKKYCEEQCFVDWGESKTPDRIYTDEWMLEGL